MTLLNPWAILLLFLVVYIFKDIVFFKNNLYTKQSKLLLLALIFLILALSRPVFENQLSKQKFDANEYIIALDASYSMNANDLQPSRYTVAKDEIISLLNIDTKDRFTIFAFTSNPLLICPPTTDTEIAINALNALSPRYILTKGTSISSLLHTVSKLDQDKKSLIIFSDGGEENDINKLLKIAKQSAITINIVAVASKRGTTIKKDNIPIKDRNNNLVISRINPILKDLANLSGGFYYEITNNTEDISKQIYSKLKENNQKEKEIKTDIISYKEIYYYPLILALIILITTLTKFQKYVPFLSILLVFVPNYVSYASVFDFYYLKKANKSYIKKEYKNSAINFTKITPSISSYLNIANAYYKATNYKMAMRYYSLISSTNPKIKQKVFYNMGNCAVKLKHLDRAKNYYQKALAFGFDKDTYENLSTLYKLGIKTKIAVSDMMPHTKTKNKKNSSKKLQKQKPQKNKDENQKSKNQNSSNSQQKASIKKQGSGQKKKSKNSLSMSQYKLGYKAYELINKGYTNEKNPW